MSQTPTGADVFQAMSENVMNILKQLLSMVNDYIQFNTEVLKANLKTVVGNIEVLKTSPVMRAAAAVSKVWLRNSKTAHVRNHRN